MAAKVLRTRVRARRKPRAAELNFSSVGPPTTRRIDILMTIARLTAANGFAPSYREIAAEVGMHSTNAVREHIWRLMANGLLNCEHRQARTMRLTYAGRSLLARERREAAERYEAFLRRQAEAAAVAAAPVVEGGGA
jgi:SOS-response transcriptional repressor LexA